MNKQNHGVIEQDHGMKKVKLVITKPNHVEFLLDLARIKLIHVMRRQKCHNNFLYNGEYRQLYSDKELILRHISQTSINIGRISRVTKILGEICHGSAMVLRAVGLGLTAKQVTHHPVSIFNCYIYDVQYVPVGLLQGTLIPEFP